MSALNAIKKIQRKIRSSRIDALFVTGENNIRYITGFHFPGMALVFKKNSRPICFVDPMNGSLAAKLLTGKEIDLVPGYIRRNFTCFVKTERIKRLGYEDEAISVREYNRITKMLPKTQFISGVKETAFSEVIEKAREIKTPEEIEVLRTAAKKTAAIWRKARKNIKTRMSEKEIASMIDILIKEAGFANSFPTIAAIAENSAYPHAIPTNKRLKMGEHVLVDFGIRYKGYCSDLTRIYLNGRIDRQIRDMIDCVRRAQDLVVKTASEGVKIKRLAETVGKLFRSFGFEKLTLHGLGHGVGLDIHEKPFLHEKCADKLKDGMVVAIEPGLYKENLGGARKEDIILIKKKGCEVLTV